jgi:hypothetical protein
VQNQFSQFESHIITTIQSALNSYNQFMSGQAERQKAMYADIAGTATNIPLDFEWNGFVKRNGNVLINPNAAPRTIDGISFPNQNHRATKPLIEGSLERKSRGIGMGYKSGYYAITPAGYLHQFKDNDNFHSDPVPDVSLYLPDSSIGAVDGQKFTIKGKDSSGSKLGQKMSMSSEFQFKAHTSSDAAQWHSIIAGLTTGGATNSLPTSPVESRNITPVATNVSQQQEGVTPTSAGGNQQQGSISPQNTNTAAHHENAGAGAAAPQSATSPTASAGSPVGQAVSTDDKHYHGAPAQNALGEREYVAKQ